MAPANPKTHKDISLSRVPADLLKQLEREAKKDQLSLSDVIRRILKQHFKPQG